MKKAPKIIKVVLVNLCLLAVLLEAASLAFYYWKTGEFFYARNRSTDSFASKLAGPIADKLDGPTVFQLHPFFGYTFKPGSRPVANAPAANNYGFVSAYDYPFKRRTENQFIIGVFGGSLAHLLTLYEAEHQILTHTLQQLPSLHNKEIVLLNFGGLGYKQPQQAIILNYFLSIGQEFDLVINIDGFNEIAFSVLNKQRGIEISLPCSQTVLPLLDIANNDFSSREVDSAVAMLGDKDGLKKSLAAAKESRLAARFVLAALEIKYYSRMFGRHLNQFNDLGRNQREQNRIAANNGIGAEIKDEVVYQQAAEIWANSSISMKNILLQRHTPYYHFLEPNQYYATARKFTEEEKNIAINPTSGFAASIGKGYPILLSRIPDLREAKVDFFSGVNIFDSISESVYADECCHYNNVGNEALSQYVSGEIKKALSISPRQPSRP